MEIHKFWEKVKDKPNVIGIDGKLRPKIRKGKVYRDIKCIRIYVTKKVPLEEVIFSPSLKERFKRIFNKNSCLHKKDLVPSFIEGIPTDLVVTGKIIAGRKVNPMNRKRFRPLKAGCSSMHYKGTACTLNGFFKDEKGKVFVASNNHCYALTNKGKRGDPILQPSPFDNGHYPKDTIGNLSFYIPIKIDKHKSLILRVLSKVKPKRKKEYNKVDIAFAQLKEDWLPEVTHIGPFKGKRIPREGEVVQKSGRTTEYTKGKVVSLNWTGYVEYDRGKAIFTDCILIEGKGFSKGGDSVTGDSLLYFKENGSIRFGTLREVVESFNKGNRIEVLSVKENLRTAEPVWAEVVNAKSHGIKPVKEVVFTNGKRIKITKDHCLFKHQPYRYKSTLIDRIVPAKIDNPYKKRFVTIEKFSRPFIETKLTEKELELLGYWLGDGWFEEDKGIGFSTGNDVTTLKFLKSFCRANNLNLSWKAKGDRRIYSKDFVRKMKKLGFSTGSSKKRVPNFIFLLSKKKIAAFIRGYFMADGSFHVDNSETPKRTFLEFGSVSLELLLQIQILLNNFGIQSVLDSGFRNKLSPNLQYKLRISRVESQKKFIKMIGLPANKTNQECLRILENQKGSGKERAISLRKVRKVSNVGEEEVFDLTVIPSQNFVANGVLCHNSGSPVQDLKGNYIGALFAGSETHTIVCKISNIESESGLKLLTEKEKENENTRKR